MSKSQVEDVLCSIQKVLPSYSVCIVNNTFETTDTAHSSENSGLHFNIPHSGLISFPQILQFLFLGEGAQSSIQSALTYRNGKQDLSGDDN